MGVHEALHICNSNSIKVYPVIFNRSFKVEVDYKGKIITYDKTLTIKGLNNAIKKTLIFYAKKVNTK